MNCACTSLNAPCRVSARVVSCPERRRVSMTSRCLWRHVSDAATRSSARARSSGRSRFIRILLYLWATNYHDPLAARRTNQPSLAAVCVPGGAGQPGYSTVLGWRPHPRVGDGRSLATRPPDTPARGEFLFCLWGASRKLIELRGTGRGDRPHFLISYQCGRDREPGPEPGFLFLRERGTYSRRHPAQDRAGSAHGQATAGRSGLPDAAAHRGTRP